jgi:hypothetical protein
MAHNGAVKANTTRGVRERFREDAEKHYDKLIASLLDALEAETVRWGDCPNCKHRVPVSFPDIRARTQAIQVLVDQGYGKPTETTRVETPESRVRQLTDEELRRVYLGHVPGFLKEMSELERGEFAEACGFSVGPENKSASTAA